MLLAHNAYLVDEYTVERGLQEALRKELITAEEAETQRILWHQNYEDIGAIALNSID